MSEYCPPETPDAYEGYMRDFCNEDGTFIYLAGFFMKANRGLCSNGTENGYKHVNILQPEP
jgi:hypothetical protein